MNSDGRSAVRAAAVRDCQDCLGTLIESGANIDAKDDCGKTALAEAAEVKSPYEISNTCVI